MWRRQTSPQAIKQLSTSQAIDAGAAAAAFPIGVATCQQCGDGNPQSFNGLIERP
jgi:hypothetical protein